MLTKKSSRTVWYTISVIVLWKATKLAKSYLIVILQQLSAANFYSLIEYAYKYCSSLSFFPHLFPICSDTSFFLDSSLSDSSQRK